VDFLVSQFAALDAASWYVILGYVALHIACAVLCLPCSPFTLIAGSLWGIWPGILISSMSALIAAGATFAIGRKASGRMGSGALARWPFLRRATEIAKRLLGMGWQSVVLVQGNPLVPASSVGYAFGMTKIPARTFLVTTFLATLPLQTVLVATGAMAHDATVLRKVHTVVVFSMITATALLGAWIWIRHRLQLSAADADALLKGNGNAK
jgi:uncharacterized membrane protein YdjX (TVP38/TMEM64 family)